MPFKNTKSGITVWHDSDNSHFEANKNKLFETTKSKDEITLPSVIQNQLSSLMESTLQGAQRLANSNNSRAKSLNAVVRSGIQPVDIVLPVYGSLHVVKPCIEAVLSRTYWPFNLIIVDDCSPDNKTKSWIEDIAKEHDNIVALFNTKNKGFAATVNKGISHGENPYVCILNSDVLVTDSWLTKMVLALEADPRNKIVNPMTNNTALINVPMQEGASYLDMNRALEMTSSHLYPEIMPTGFCFMFERSLLNDIGMFDEGFESYGEETDLWMRVVSHVEQGEYLRWRAVLADDTYLFHERGTSFSSLGDIKHNAKRQAGSARFHAIWPGFKQWQKNFDVERVMAPYRKGLPDRSLKLENSPYNIAFVVYSTAFCGGMNFIADVVNEMNERGINAKVVLIKRPQNSNKIPVLSELRSCPIVFDSPEQFENEFSEKVFSKGVVVAATGELIPTVNNLCTKPDTQFQSVLLAQSDDPALSPDPEQKRTLKENYKKINYIIAGSEWLEKTINSYGGNCIGYFHPGVNSDLFYHRNREDGDERPTILFILMKNYFFKGYDRGLAVARDLLALCKRNNTNVRIMALGPVNIPECPDIIGLGNISQSQLASLLGTEIDYLVDPSHIHSYGLPALEALTSGVVPITWENKGIREYADDKSAIIIPNDMPSSAVANHIWNKITLPPDSKWPYKQHDRKDGVNKVITLLEERLALNSPKRSISIITPHLRKNGGPTTILNMANLLQKRGHDVRLYSVYPDINPEIADMSEVPISVDWKNIKQSDILISNSDNDRNNFFASYSKVNKKIMLKLSHNPRFQSLEDESLKLPWDAIMTSTEWLKNACEKPLVDAGWTHDSKKATRVGWYHYGHETFSTPPNMRKYGSLSGKIKLAFLAHNHPLKGTNEALKAMQFIKQKYKDRVEIYAVGESPEFAKKRPSWIAYLFTPNRDQMAEFMSQIDIWVSASHSEGLGRMALEAMSSSCAVVMSDTGAEFAEDGKNCLVAGRGNISQIVKHVDKLITEPELFSQIVKNGYETACKYADPTEHIENIEKVIQCLNFDEV